jgi:hypothetical protein
VTTWNVVLLAAVLVLALKIAGYLVPARVLERPTPSRVATLLTVALLAALVVTQTVQGDGRHPLSIDARLPALGASAVLLALRAPFIVVVVAAAVVAALLRLAGWMA